MASQLIKDNGTTIVQRRRFHNLPDEIIDYDWTPIRRYIADDSWQALMEKSKPYSDTFCCVIDVPSSARKK